MVKNKVDIIMIIFFLIYFTLIIIFSSQNWINIGLYFLVMK